MVCVSRFGRLLSFVTRHKHRDRTIDNAVNFGIAKATLNAKNRARPKACLAQVCILIRREW